MLITQPGQLYVVAKGEGFNSHWAGHLWSNGVIGPLSADEAKRIYCLGHCHLFEYKPDHEVRYLNGEPFYERIAPPAKPAKPAPAAKAKPAKGSKSKK